MTSILRTGESTDSAVTTSSLDAAREIAMTKAVEGLEIALEKLVAAAHTASEAAANASAVLTPKITAAARDAAERAAGASVAAAETARSKGTELAATALASETAHEIARRAKAVAAAAKGEIDVPAPKRASRLPKVLLALAAGGGIAAAVLKMRGSGRIESSDLYPGGSGGGLTGYSGSTGSTGTSGTTGTTEAPPVPPTATSDAGTGAPTIEPTAGPDMSATPAGGAEAGGTSIGRVDLTLDSNTGGAAGEAGPHVTELPPATTARPDGELVIDENG